MANDRKEKHTAVDEMALEEAINTAFAGLPIGAHPRVLVRAAVEAYESAKQQPTTDTQPLTSHAQWPLVAKEQWEVEQILGKALGYPWYKDDPKNFPDATEADGVCTGEHTYLTLAMEAAKLLSNKPTDTQQAAKCSTCSDWPLVRYCSECGNKTMQAAQPDKAEVVERMAGAFYNVIPPESHTDSHNWHTYCHTLAEIALQYLPAEALPPQRDDSLVEELSSGLKWLHDYISGYCVIVHPKKRNDGTLPEAAILTKIDTLLDLLAKAAQAKG